MPKKPRFPEMGKAASRRQTKLILKDMKNRDRQSEAISDAFQLGLLEGARRMKNWALFLLGKKPLTTYYRHLSNSKPSTVIRIEAIDSELRGPYGKPKRK